MNGAVSKAVVMLVSGCNMVKVMMAQTERRLTRTGVLPRERKRVNRERVSICERSERDRQAWQSVLFNIGSSVAINH